MIKKIVDIEVKSPVLGTYEGIVNDAYSVELSIADIKANLVRGNRVYEILNNGKRLLLDMDNFATDNNVYVATDSVTENIKETKKEEKTVPLKDSLASSGEFKKPVSTTKPETKKEEAPKKSEKEENKESNKDK